MRYTAIACLLGLLIAPAAAQFAPLPSPTLLQRVAPRAAWTSVGSAGTPVAGSSFRADNPGAASFDKLYVFGGCLDNNTATTVNDLWEFDPAAGTFQQVHSGAGTAPHARGRAAVAWNFATGRLIVFGGDNRSTGPLPANTLLNDTWEWNPANNTWTDVTPASGNPSPRRWSAMAWDPITGGMLMFGGDLGSNAVSAETWLFVGGVWNQLSPATVPPARRMASLMTRTDDLFNDVLMCGGEDNSLSGPYGADLYRHLDVWQWTAGNWTRLSDWDWNAATGTFPAGAMANQAVYDSLRKRVVMQGGQGIAANTASNVNYLFGTTIYNGSPTNFTSEFDCLTNTWVLYGNPTTGTTPYNNTDPVIGRISRYYGGFIQSTGKVYKACGQNGVVSGARPTFNVYQYQASPAAAATVNGLGCAGSAGLMTLTPDSLPWTGRTFQITGAGFAAGALGFAILGFGTQNVPLSVLHPAGGAGCSLLVTADNTFLLLPSGGQAAFPLNVPPGTTLAGLTIQCQMLSVELSPSFNITTIASTNALAATIGAL